MFKQFIAASCLFITSTVTLAADANIIYLTRHAEKATGSDPSLTTQGQERAANIAQFLKRANITSIYSTDYNRTQQTAKPLSDSISVSVTSYDPNQLSSFATQLKGLPGNTLVVGHSNTTPDLVDLLGGQSGSAISETEFDRLYQVIIGDNGQVTTVLLTSLPSVDVVASCDDVIVNASGLAASTGNWVYESIEVPECANTLTVNMTGSNGDADLYVRSGSQPTDTLYNCRPFIGGSNESCTIDNPTAGTWHIGVKAYQSFSNVSLAATAKD